jgi:phosphoglucosamine mutase
MINVKLPEKRDVVALPAVQEAVKTAEAELADTGRVLLRPSGTEPVVRVMVEGEDVSVVKSVCTSLAKTVEQIVNAG